jgi:iron(III) transport system ATP-binding protein
VGLAGLEERPATKLSGGQQQRLALCRALVYEPDLVLLDEPFSNLDAKLREQMRVELKSLQQRLNVTVLFVTHDQLEALSLSDTIAVMNLGRVEQVGAPRALYEAPRSPFVRDFLGQNLLLDCRVLDVLEGSWLRVRVDGLSPETCVTGRAAPGWLPTAGDRVKLAARPEDAELIAADGLSRDGVLHAVTRSALFLGDRYQVHLELANGTQLLLHAPRTALSAWAPNERVGVRLAPDAVMVWPA